LFGTRQNQHAQHERLFHLKKNRKDNGQNGNEKNGKTVGRSFSNHNFRKELNAMAKDSSKKEALDLCASAIARKQTKYDKAHKKKASAKRKVILSDSEEDSSDSDESFHLIKKKKSSSKKMKVQCVRVGETGQKGNKAIKRTDCRRKSLH
jgi:hypothetical protein